MGIFRASTSPPFVEPQKYSLYVSPHLSRLQPHRVVIVPTGTESGRYQVPLQFAEALASAIRLAGLTEVVIPTGGDCHLTVDRILSGQFEECEILDLAKTWNCDAVLFVRVNQLQAHAPLRACVTAALVDTRESVVIFAMDGNWDLADAEIRMGFEHFLNTRCLDLPATQQQLQRRSPHQLFAYIAHQITRAWYTSL